MARNTAESLAALEEYLTKHQPSIKLLTPSSPDFEGVRACFIKRDDLVPLAIARPQTAVDVQVLVKYCVQHNIDFVVRSGGHDCAGRSQVRGALTIDMRDINYVRVSADEKTASVGGGIVFRDLAKALEARELMTPVGTVASVGYVGWATLGGYGPFSSSHGLGVDQIVGAKVVKAKGELVDAGEELLRGIRGAGGIFGVITELTVKIFPLKGLFVSLIVFDSSDLTTTWMNYSAGYEKLAAEQDIPRALQLHLLGIELPNFGKVFAVAATWSAADHEEGKIWINKIAALGPCLMNNPEVKTVSAYCAFNESLLTWGSYGRAYTLSVKKYTPKLAEVLAKYTSSLPGGGIAISLHMLREPAPNEHSVFGSRVEHHMLEMIAATPVKELEAKGTEWAAGLTRELREADPENVMESAYISLLDNDDMDCKKIYGAHYETLVALKKKYDPDNVFKYAIPRLSV
ncbi:FAD-binding domain-containing protein [Annulohypoxylon maeteangense]|uniref:FAD-binding domain-containing protein n=1 Tax=Annulohypoxylon maeteangense TaxID=1927788 RepID=UPI00200896E9|nr:FAD-binding domain-containing protein [Annulohypoxylon maeteangense]KAI0886631.1 FAD-binding domain-containing protein [Annulohypoxylon maeteangense]